MGPRPSHTTYLARIYRVSFAVEFIHIRSRSRFVRADDNPGV
jgi:hypothetical protein